MVFLLPSLPSMDLASSRQKRGAQTPLNHSSSPIQFDLAGFLSYFWSIYHSFPLHFPSFFNQRLRSLLAACCLLVAHHVGTGPPILIISPSELDFGTLLVGSTATLQTAVNNLGGQPLTWHVDTGGARRVSVVPGSVPIPTGGPQATNVTPNVSRLPSAPYTADLHFHLTAMFASRVWVRRVTPRIEMHLPISMPRLTFACAPPIVDRKTIRPQGANAWRF